MRRLPALVAWCGLVWLTLTWMITAEGLLVGAAVCLAAAAATATFGPAAGPWRLLRPAGLVPLARLGGGMLWRIVVANLRLSGWVWTSGRPPASGMVAVPTRMRSTVGLAEVGILTSLVVENQIVDLDRGGKVLLYHVLRVPEGDRTDAYRAMNGPIESLVAPLVHRG